MNTKINISKTLFLTFAIGLFLLSCSQKGWQRLSQSNFEQKLEETEEKVIIDVRTRAEYRKSHLEGAFHDSYLKPGFGKRADSLDRNIPVFLYCETAHRSPFAARKLKRKGFREIYELEDGMKTWRKTGRDYVEGED